jgi:glycerol kinase
MTASGLYLALDQGGHASRAILYDTSGRSLQQSFAPIATRHTPEGHIEHDPTEIVDSLKTAAADLIDSLDSTVPIVAAGLATQRSSIVCWNRNTGEALSPVISWQDRRNAAWVETLQPHAERIRKLTGLVLSPHYGASKLRWCLDNLPQVQRAATTGELALGPLSSFLLFHLLPNRPLVVDPANASRTQLWNPETRQWAPDLLEWFAVPAEHLPQPVASRHAYGTLEVGERRIPFTVCTGDQSAVPFAFGSARADAAYINFGTGAFVQRPLVRALEAGRASSHLLCSILWSDEQTITAALEGTVNGAGSALEWISQQEGLETRRMLTSLGAAPDPQIRPPLFLNGISGLGSPFWIADFQSRFAGNGTAPEKFIAVLESILFLVRVNLEEMQPRHARLNALVATGGLAASDFLCQSLADLTNLPVTRYEEQEATARGLAFLIAGQPQEWPAPRSQVFQPQLNTALRERFFAWLKLMKQAIRKN